MSKYDKMRSMGIPDGAIRHKMKQDGIESKDIANFFQNSSSASFAPPSSTPSSSSSSRKSASPADALRHREDMAKYFKMRKLGLPDGPIRQKMMTDGVGSSDVATFFGDVPTTKSANSAAPVEPSAALRETLSKYFKMKKLGLPDGAIRQKMMTDGIDATDMAMFFGEPTQRREAPDNVPRIDLSVLRAQQTARRQEMKGDKTSSMAKYFKMQSMGIPIGAIRQKMKNDAVAVADIAAFCGDLPSGPPPKGGPTKAQRNSQKARSKLKQLHWKKLDDKRAKNSLWNTLDSSTDSPQRQKLEKEMAEHFGKKTARNKKKGSNGRNDNSQSNGSTLKPKGPQRILDGKRARNIEIGLAQFRAFSKFETLANVVCSLDQSRLSTDRLETLLDISPTTMEIRSIENVISRMNTTQINNLGAAEKFHVSMMKVSRFREKVQCFLFKSGWDDHCDRLDDQCYNLKHAIEDILHCKGLTKVLETVLSVGNLMNKGTHAGDAKGITLDSLLKLTSTKSHDNKMTVLDYVVQTMLSNDKKKGYTTFPSELLKLKDATKCSPKVLKNSLKILEKGVQHMKREAATDLKAISTQDSTEEDAGEEKTNSGTLFTRGIEKFLKKHAAPKLEKYQEEIRRSDELCDQLRDHFGEDPTCDVVTLFDVLNKFSTAFATSVKKTTDRQARQRRMSQQAESRGRRRASRSPERGEGKGGEGKEGGNSPTKRGGRRSSRSPKGRRSRGSSVEGKRGGSSSGGNSGDTGGPNLLAAIMAKGGIGGLKRGIQMKQSASPGTKQRHEQQESLMAVLLQMGHEREEVSTISQKMMKNKSLEDINGMLDGGERSINRRLDTLKIPRVMSESEKRVAMLSAMMAGRK